MSIKLSPLNDVQLKALKQLSEGIQAEQINWLNGYFQGLAASFAGASMQATTKNAVVAPAEKLPLTIIYGSHTGRGEKLAKDLCELATAQNIDCTKYPMDDYKTKQLKDETNLLVIVSTHGEGEPPEMAEDFHRFITSKRAPKLPDLNYSVLALGDRSYKLFCQTGFDIEQALKKAGANELLPIVTCDVDYEEESALWIDAILLKLEEQAPSVVGQEISTEIKTEAPIYNKKNPFRATVLDKVKITGRDSDKEVYHVEISLEGSDLTYQSGDSLGILADNPPVVVEKLLNDLKLDAETTVKIKKGEFSLLTALKHHLEVTILTRDVIKKYADKTELKPVQQILNDEKLLDEYLWGHDVLDLVHEFPFVFTAQELVDLLRPLPPRLYSIASSQTAVGEEVHITVSTVRYETKGREREGACSTFLADRIDLDHDIPVYIERNPGFRLPENENTPIIMVGAGTGVAPFRAFLQEREANNLKGKSWLFFGERHFSSDFLYQLEWQKHLKKGYLERIDLAFSRDQEEKIYVQNKLKEQKQELFQWLENGASFYLCGDMKYMAKDVQTSLLEIIREQGGMTKEKAKTYLKKLKKAKRFQTDVY